MAREGSPNFETPAGLRAPERTSLVAARTNVPGSSTSIRIKPGVEALPSRILYDVGLGEVEARRHQCADRGDAPDRGPTIVNFHPDARPLQVLAATVPARSPLAVSFLRGRHYQPRTVSRRCSRNPGTRFVGGRPGGSRSGDVRRGGLDVRYGDPRALHCRVTGSQPIPLASWARTRFQNRAARS